MTLRTNAAILIAILIAVLTPFTTNAAPLDPTTGVIAHSFLDRESDVFVGMLTVGKESYGFSFLNEYTSLPNNGYTDVYTITSDTLVFAQNNTTYTASIVTPLEYNGILADRFYKKYEDGSECNLFHMTVIETGEVITICLDPTDNPNMNEGPVSINFVAPWHNTTMWNGSLAQVINGKEYVYPFQMTQDTYQVHKTYIISRL